MAYLTKNKNNHVKQANQLKDTVRMYVTIRFAYSKCRIREGE